MIRRRRLGTHAAPPYVREAQRVRPRDRAGTHRPDRPAVSRIPSAARAIAGGGAVISFGGCRSLAEDMPSHCVNALALPDAEPPAECDAYAVRDTAAWAIPTTVVGLALLRVARSKWFRSHVAAWQAQRQLLREAPQQRETAAVRYGEIQRLIEAREYAAAAIELHDLLLSQIACGNTEVVRECAIRGMLLAALIRDAALVTTICDDGHDYLHRLPACRQEAAQLRLLLHLIYRHCAPEQENLAAAHAMYVALTGRRILVMDFLGWLQPQLLAIGIPQLSSSPFQAWGAYLHTVAPPDQDGPGSIPPQQPRPAIRPPAAAPSITPTPAAPAAASTAPSSSPAAANDVDDRFRMLELD